MPFRFTNRIFHALLVALTLSAICAAQNPAARRRPWLRRSLAGGNVSKVPVAVSPGNWSQLASIIPPPGLYFVTFGEFVAVSGDTLAVSTGILSSNSIAAYIYLKTAQGWQTSLPKAALALPPSASDSGSVAIDGDTVVTCSSGGPGGSGYVYVYVKPPGGWTDMMPTATLTPAVPLDGYFGRSVAISGDTIVVGDPAFDSLPGTAYVFVKPAGGWVNMTETATLTASDGTSTDYFGTSVSVSGSTITVGAPQDQASPGKAYVFVEPGSGWSDMTQTAELTASDAQPNWGVGEAVSVNGDNILVGAPNTYNYAQNYPPGHAYVFTKPPSGWTNMTQTAELVAADGAQYDTFGVSLAMSGRRAAVGTCTRGRPPNEGQGGIYVFEEPAGGWQNSAGRIVLTGSDARRNTCVGVDLGLSGNVLAGATWIYPGGAFLFGLP